MHTGVAEHPGDERACSPLTVGYAAEDDRPAVDVLPLGDLWWECDIREDWWWRKG